MRFFPIAQLIHVTSLTPKKKQYTAYPDIQFVRVNIIIVGFGFQEWFPYVKLLIVKICFNSKITIKFDLNRENNVGRNREAFHILWIYQPNVTTVKNQFYDIFIIRWMLNLN